MYWQGQNWKLLKFTVIFHDDRCWILQYFQNTSVWLCSFKSYRVVLKLHLKAFPRNIHALKVNYLLNKISFNTFSVKMVVDRPILAFLIQKMLCQLAKCLQIYKFLSWYISDILLSTMIKIIINSKQY